MPRVLLLLKCTETRWFAYSHAVAFIVRRPGRPCLCNGQANHLYLSRKCAFRRLCLRTACYTCHPESVDSQFGKTNIPVAMICLAAAAPTSAAAVAWSCTTRCASPRDANTGVNWGAMLGTCNHGMPAWLLNELCTALILSEV